MRRRETFIVTVVKPREREGKNWYHLIRGPWTNGEPYERRVSSKTPDRAEAEKRAAEMTADLNAQLRARTPGGYGADPRFLDIFDAHLLYIQTVDKAADNTVECYETVRKALAPAFAELRESTLTPEAVMLGRDAVRVGRKATTVNLYFGLAKTSWTWAKKRGHVKVDWPEIDRLPEEHTDKRPMAVEEQQGAIDYYRDRSSFWHGYFALAQVLGPRSSEQRELREGVNLRRDQQRVFETPDGLRETFVLVAFKTKKSRKKPSKIREVWVPKSVVDLIPVRPEGEWLFPGRNRRRRGNCVSQDGVLDALRRALRAIGVRDWKNVDAHSWRRSACNDTEDAMLPERVAMEWSGHDSSLAFNGYKRRAPKKTFVASTKLWEYRQRTLAQRRAETELASTGPSGLVEAGAPNPRLPLSPDGNRTSCSSAGTDRT